MSAKLASSELDSRDLAKKKNSFWLLKNIFLRKY